MLAKNSEIGGLTSSIKSLAEGLLRYTDTETIVAICAGDSVDTTLKDIETHIIPFDSKSPLQMIANYRRMSALIREKQIDLLHAQNRITAVYAAVYHFFHRRIPYLWANHQTPIPSGFFHRLMTRYGFMAVAEGENGRKLLISDLRIPQEKVEVINLGVELSGIERTSPAEQERLRKANGIAPEEKVLLLYGRLDRSKGHTHLLQALSSLTDHPFRVVFPGEDEEYKQELLQLAKTLGMEGRLIFPGFIKGAPWLSITDLMVLPSRQEGFGIANIESFALGVPVIRSKTGGFLEMQDLCFGIDYGDVEALQGLLTRFFAGDPAFRERAEKALSEVGRFSLETEARAYHDLYRRALAAAQS